MAKQKLGENGRRRLANCGEANPGSVFYSDQGRDNMISDLTTAKGVVLAGEEMQPLWDAYVEQHKDATHCHCWAWKRVIENAFHHPTYYLAATDQGKLTGVLPLVWQHSRVFGSFLTSMPFLNAGGVLAGSAEVEDELVRHAIELTRRLHARHLQLRYRGECRLALPSMAHKIAAVRPVWADSDAMFAALDKKVRTDIKKAIKSGLTARAEGAEALEQFYAIYAANMRELGTPVYGRNFFAEILNAFSGAAEIVVVRREGEAIAATLLVRFRGVMEAGWSGSLRRYLPLKPNMLLYWTNLCVAGERGCTVFDFGRSTRDSGTHHFKRQWGTEDIPLHWAQWPPRQADRPELDPTNPKYRLAIALWKKLPLPLTRLIGPGIVKHLP